MVGGSAAWFHEDDVIAIFVALVSRVGGRLEADKAELAAQHEERPVDDRHDESLLVGHRVTDSIQTTVLAGHHIAPVTGAQCYRPVALPFYREQTSRRPET